MRIQLYTTYIDQSGIEVEIIHKLEKGKRRFVGLIKWENLDPEVDLYNSTGKCDLEGYHLVKKKKEPRKKSLLYKTPIITKLDGPDRWNR